SEARARPDGCRSGIDGVNQADREAVSPRSEPSLSEVHLDELAHPGQSLRSELRRVRHTVLESNPVAAVEVAAEARPEDSALRRRARAETKVRRGDGELHSRTTCDRPSARTVERSGDAWTARFRRAVDVADSRLPVCPPPLVVRKEQQHPLDRRLAESNRESLPIVGGLGRLAHRLGRRRLPPRVRGGLWRPEIPHAP